MTLRPQQLTYKSDALINGRILTHVTNPSVKDVKPVLRHWVGSRAIVELDLPFKKFQCKSCGKVDELRCLQQGITSTFTVPKPRTDLHVTEEYFYLFSQRLASLIMEAAGDELFTFKLPHDPGYVVPWPKKVIDAPSDSGVYVEGEEPKGLAFRPHLPRCGSCGRWGGMTFWDDYFIPPTDIAIAGVGVEVEHPPMWFRELTWILSGELAKVIKGAAFTNVRIIDSFASSPIEKGSERDGKSGRGAKKNNR